MTKIYEVKLVPKDLEASIRHIVVRVDDPINIQGYEECVDFIEAQFPMYDIERVMEGFKDDRNRSTSNG